MTRESEIHQRLVQEVEYQYVTKTPTPQQEENHTKFVSHVPTDMAYLLEELAKLHEALRITSELANAVLRYDWIYMLSDDDTRMSLYDASVAWKKIRDSVQLGRTSYDISKENQRLRSALEKYVKECPTCGGTGIIEDFVAHHGIPTAPDNECPDCHWANEALWFGYIEK